MPYSKDKKVWQAQLDLIKLYAPDQKSEYLIDHIVESARTEDLSDKDIAIMLTSVLIDGLRHGNWPWEFKKLLKEKSNA